MEGIDEKRMSNKRIIDSRKFPGATISNMCNYLISLLEKKPDHVILNVGTNEQMNEQINVDKLLQLKNQLFKKNSPVPTLYFQSQ